MTIHASPRTRRCVLAATCVLGVLIAGAPALRAGATTANPVPGVGGAMAGSAGTISGAASASQYRWPLFHDDPQLTGTSADPGLSTASAGKLGVHWMANLGASTLSSPMVAYNAALGKTLVFVGNEAGYFTAYDQATGLPVWSVQTGAPVRSSPLAEGGSVWVAPNRAFRLYKLNAATGAVECSAPTPMGLIVDATPTIATPPGGEPTVYIGVNCRAFC